MFEKKNGIGRFKIEMEDWRKYWTIQIPEIPDQEPQKIENADS